MVFYKKSTKIQPLLFFETFISIEKMRLYEDSFYDYPINPSQESFKELGYKQYLKDTYEDGEEFKPLKVFFIDELKRLLEGQSYKSIKLIRDRKDKLEYKNVSGSVFIEKQLKIVENLQNYNFTNSDFQKVVTKVLRKIEQEIKLLDNKSKATILIPLRQNSSNAFFEPKNNTKSSTLRKLYQLAVDYRLIGENFKQEFFLNVFIVNTPQHLDNKIVFKVDNQKAIFFLNSISVFFHDFTHSRIAKSESFIKKSGKPFSQGDLDTAKTRFEKKVMTEKQKNLKKAIDDLYLKTK